MKTWTGAQGAPADRASLDQTRAFRLLWVGPYPTNSGHSFSENQLCWFESHLTQEPETSLPLDIGFKEMIIRDKEATWRKQIHAQWEALGGGLQAFCLPASQGADEVK